MPIQITAQEARPHPSPKQRTKRFSKADADERRLLGDYGDEEKSKATAIVPPGKRVRPEIMGNKATVTGGFTPRNTLKNPLSQQWVQERISQTQGFHTRTAPLSTYASYGDNVRTPLGDLSLDHTCYESANGNGKRRKLTHVNEVEEIDSDDLEAQDPRSVTLSHKPLKPSANASVSEGTVSWRAMGSTTPPNPSLDTASVRCSSKSRHPHGIRDIKEAGPVDLCSGREDDRTSSPDLTRELLASLETNADQVNSSPIKAMDNSSTGDRSKYFDKSSLRNHTGRTSQILTRPKSSGQGRAQHDGSSSLGKRFVDVDGRRRGRQSSSPDALAGGKTIGVSIGTFQVSSSPPNDRRQSRSPKNHVEKNSWSGLKEVYSSECEPSIIPRSTFKNGKRREMDSSPAASRASRQGESELPWNIPLNAIVFNGEYKEEQGFVLIYSRAKNAYAVKQNVLDFSAVDPSLILYPTKLKKIIHDGEGRRIRFESAKVGTSDHRMDVRMRSEKDAWALIQRLESETNSTSIKEVSPDRMENMFRHHRNERRPEKKKSTHSQDEVPDDIKLTKANVNRRREGRNDGRMPSLDEQEERRRQQQQHHGNRVVDRMNGESEPSQGAVGHMKRTLSTYLSKPAKHETGAYAESNKPFPSQDILGKADERNSTVLQGAISRLTKGSNHPSKPQDNELGIEPMAYDDRQVLRSRVQQHEDAMVETNYIRNKAQKWGKRWTKPLTFPQSGPKKTTVEWEDLDRLEEDEFFNDNLIAFYLRYLEEKLRLESPDTAKKVYFFNSYFFASLTNGGGRTINYNAVKNWTRNIDLLSYDYVIVPINQAFHWYCAIICNLTALPRELGSDVGSPSEVANEAHDDVDDGPEVPVQEEERRAIPDSENGSPGMGQPQVEEEDEKKARSSFAEMSLGPKASEQQAITDGQSRGQVPTSNVSDLDREGLLDTVEDANASQSTNNKGKRKFLPPKRTVNPASPAIVTFDSLELTRAPAIKSLKDYVKAEAETRRGGMVVDLTLIKGMTAKDIPRQPNASDCGPIMLRYIEKLLEDPKDFVSRTLSKEFDLENDWPAAQTEGMRDKIAILIKQLHDEQTNMLREEAKRQGKYKNVRSEGDAASSSPGPLKSANATSDEQFPNGRATECPVPNTNASAIGDNISTGPESMSEVTLIHGSVSMPEHKRSIEPLLQEQHREKKIVSRSPESDHFAAAPRSPSAGENFLQPYTSLKPENAISLDGLKAPLEASSQSFEVSEPQKECPILIKSQSQSVEGSNDQVDQTLPQRGLSAYQVTLQKKTRLAQTQASKPAQEPPAQGKERVQVADSQSEHDGRDENFESLFEAEGPLEDLDELQDSAYDHPSTNGPWAKGYSAQPSMESPRKRKASQSPVSSSHLSYPERRRDNEDDDGGKDEAANRQLQEMQFEQMPPERALRASGSERVSHPQPQRKEESPKKRGRKKKKTVGGMEQKSSPPVIYELSD